VDISADKECARRSAAAAQARSVRLLAAGLCVLVLLGGCFNLPFFDRAPPVYYDIAGLEHEHDEALRDYLEQIIEDQFATPIEAETAEEQQRQQSYRERLLISDLQRGLRARGYYDAEVEFTGAPEPFTGTFTVQKGTLYTIEQLVITPAEYELKAVALGVGAGDALMAEAVLSAQQELYDQIQRDRCFFDLDVHHVVVLDQQTKTAELTFHVSAEQEAEFGPVEFTGLENVRRDYLDNLTTWKEGDCFRRERIEALRGALLASGLFARAEAQLPDAPDHQGRVPVTIDLRERAARTIRAGASYYSDEGAGIVLGWEHRNIFGAAERLRTQLKASYLEQSLTADLTKPHYFTRKQSLTLNTRIGRRDTDAFEEIGVRAGAALTHAFNRRLSGSTGIDLTVTRITEQGGDVANNYGLISLPQALTFDNRNDKLDPRRGWYGRLMLQPFFDAFGNGDPFLKAQFSARTYFAFGEDDKTVLALRAKVGSITAAATENVPATERFYAGGGASVRGFGFQEIGPHVDGEPVGGRSLAELSVELRHNFTERIGAVAFVDAGNVTDDSYPGFSGAGIGAGVGGRYYTRFGPLRLDVAVPVSGDQHTDRPFQFYVSIGQAF